MRSEMSEVEKMYENAGVEKRAYYNGCPKGQYLSNNLTCYECEYFSVENPYLKCSYRVYPPFTAEKQLKIIAFLVNKGYNVTFANLSNKFSLEQISKSLALCINSKWNNLTESEQEQIRSILNG